MREIKFDVILWDTVDPTTITHYNIQEAISEDFIDFTDGIMSPTDNTVIIRQYTGLKDKNGKEIYEGDILEHTLILPISVEELHGYRFMWGKDQLTKADAVYGEVIGNIYENPKLLKTE